MKRGRSRPGLDAETIVQAAIELIDRVGLDSFSMRKLSTELGVDPMAAYHYVPSKAALFDRIVELLWSRVELRGEPSAADDDRRANEDWRAVLLEPARSLRQVLLKHPQLVGLVATRPAVRPRTLQLFDSAVSDLAAHDFPADRAAMLLDCVVAYTVGKVLAEVRRPIGGLDEQTPDPHELYATLEDQDYPNLAAAMNLGYGWQPEEEFELGLQAILDGWPSGG